jgi:hypothetical protein
MNWGLVDFGIKGKDVREREGSSERGSGKNEEEIYWGHHHADWTGDPC